jgi:regulator of nonsense transcripts 1
VQLRATTQQHSKLLEFDVSLFERLYVARDCPGVVKVMLDLQYRMHRQICAFASSEFYDGKLETAVPDSSRPVPVSAIMWPSRILFAACSHPEDLGSKSKQNRGQAMLCKSICQALLSSTKSSDNHKQSLTVLTPYTRQLELLKSVIPGVDISSIDGFQGREADIIVFVTVRCNQRRELGFLKDMRRLNVAVTRARVGMIIIGDKGTLVGGNDEASAAVWARLLGKASEYRQPDLSAQA